ncbi:type II toxin-antitoxin system RelE/ParE family toxin [Flavobacterium eburneipallidum]|uniref:type II toxin-antitoxin system RelE/ParE family toxin n=1 Tax=Flavobacterium eburneipallidum TaxID=3003263 RepID=UPI0022AC661D|nr:type II toxin-antitoxin system RelE/ParE family toxin [Flavobacterium eburneipallidum]
MSYTVINHKEVKNDVLQVKNWYKSQQKGLEKRFANEVRITLNFIIKNPLLFQVKYKTVRAAYTEIFPYAVHYHLNEKTKTITLLGVFHTSLSPDKWLDRL